MNPYISEHVSFDAATYSRTAEEMRLKNIPGEAELANMRALAMNVIEKAWSHFKKRIRINSFFRCTGLNRAIKGSKSSQHVTGEAADLEAVGFKNSELFYYIKNNLDFDQLIWEHGNDNEPDWVHVSYKRLGGNRKQVLRAITVKGRLTYINF